MNELKYRLTGMTPLICHNARLSNPLDRIVRQMKEVSGKRGKTEDDLERLAELEFAGSLYIDPKTEAPAVPDTMLFAVVLGGARKFKEGKLVEAGVAFPRRYYPIEYDGPKDWKELYQYTNGSNGDRPFVDQRMVTVSRSKVLRTRPIFEEWAIEVEMLANPEVIDADQVLKWWERAGTLARIGDARVLGYGSFTAEQVE